MLANAQHRFLASRVQLLQFLLLHNQYHVYSHLLCARKPQSLGFAPKKSAKQRLCKLCFG